MRVYGISGMRHEGKLGKCGHFIVRKSVGVLVLVGKSNKEENGQMEWSNRFIEKMVRIEARIIRFKRNNEY